MKKGAPARIFSIGRLKYELSYPIFSRLLVSQSGVNSLEIKRISNKLEVLNIRSSHENNSNKADVDHLSELDDTFCIIIVSAERIASDVPLMVTFLSEVPDMKSPLSEILILAPLA